MVQHPDVARAMVRAYQDDLMRAAENARLAAAADCGRPSAHRAIRWIARAGRPATRRTAAPARAAVADGCGG